MTTTEPSAGEQKHGKHAKSNDPERTADPSAEDRESAHAADDAPDEQPSDDEPRDGEAAERDEEPEPGTPAAKEEPAPAPAPAQQPGRPETREQAAEEPKKKRSMHAVAHHPAGASLLTASGLVTGLALAPLLFDQLRFGVATRAADAALSAAPSWPAGGEPWFWPGWMAMTALVVAVIVLVVAALGVRVPDVAVLATAAVLAVTTARAAWSTFAVINAHLWELIPACIVIVLAFGSALAAVFRWRSGDSADSGSGAGEVAGVTIGAWLLVVLLALGGSAIASSAQTHAFGNVSTPPQDLAGLLSVRSADSPELADLRGAWVAQLSAAQETDDAAASTYAVGHAGWTARFSTLLARGDDLGAPDLDDTWWVSVANARFGSQEEAAAWCSANAVAGCTPRQFGG